MVRRLPALPALTPRWRVGLPPAIALALLTLLVAGPAAAQATAPIVDYRFDGDLQDSASGSSMLVHPTCDADGQPDPCNSASAFDADEVGSFWRWESSNARGGGFTLTTDGQLGETFTVGLRFRFDEVGSEDAESSSWRKIIDYQDRDSDTGFYLQGGQIQFYSLGSSEQSYAAEEILDLIAVREGAPGAVEGSFAVYVIGDDGQTTQILAVDDPDGRSIPATNGDGSLLGFFHDDLVTSSEATAGGSVYSVRVWDRALEQAEIATALEVASVNIRDADSSESGDAAEGPAVPGDDDDGDSSDLLRWVVIGLLVFVGLLVVVGIVIAVVSRGRDQDRAPV